MTYAQADDIVKKISFDVDNTSSVASPSSSSSVFVPLIRAETVCHIVPTFSGDCTISLPAVIKAIDESAAFV